MESLTGTRRYGGSSVLSDQTVRPGEYVARDFQTGLVRRKYGDAPNFTERGAVEGVQANGGVAFVVREDELPLDKPEVLLIPSAHNETVRVDSDTGRVLGREMILSVEPCRDACRTTS